MNLTYLFYNSMVESLTITEHRQWLQNEMVGLLELPHAKVDKKTLLEFLVTKAYFKELDLEEDSEDSEVCLTLFLL